MMTPMKPVRDLVLKAHEQDKLRFPPPVIDMERGPLTLELNRTGMSGLEFIYIPSDDAIAGATQTIDGLEVTPVDCIRELAEAVGEDPSDYVRIEANEEPKSYFEEHVVTLYIKGEKGLYDYSDEGLWKDVIADYFADEVEVISMRHTKVT